MMLVKYYLFLIIIFLPPTLISGPKILLKLVSMSSRYLISRETFLLDYVSLRFVSKFTVVVFVGFFLLFVFFTDYTFRRYKNL